MKPKQNPKPPHYWTAEYVCNKCGKIERRDTERKRTWIGSHCEYFGVGGARLYRIGDAVKVEGEMK